MNNANIIVKAALKGFLNNKKQVARTLMNILVTIISAVVANYIKEQEENQ